MKKTIFGVLLISLASFFLFIALNNDGGFSPILFIPLSVMYLLGLFNIWYGISNKKILKKLNGNSRISYCKITDIKPTRTKINNHRVHKGVITAIIDSRVIKEEVIISIGEPKYYNGYYQIYYMDNFFKINKQISFEQVPQFAIDMINDNVNMPTHSPSKLIDFINSVMQDNIPEFYFIPAEKTLLNTNTIAKLNK